MNVMQIHLPASNIRANYRGFNALSELGRELITIHDSEIHVDCSDLKWIDAHLSAPLMTLVNKCKRQANRVHLKNLNSSVRSILAKNNTLVRKEFDVHGTTIPLRHFELDAAVEFAQFTKKHLSRPEMPRMTPGLKLKFFEGLDELFGNCSIHSKSKVKVAASGQYYPNLDKIAFVISDGGIGIEASLAKAGLVFDQAHRAIDWAMQKSNTGRSGDVPGGLGLGILRDFVKINGGRLVVCSHNGYWETEGDAGVMKPMRTPFLGTVVTMEILTSDKRSYDVTAHVDPLTLW